MNPTDFITATRRTVTRFTADPSDRYRHAELGTVLCAGVLTFDCGHTYRWHPWAATSEPTVGSTDLCAECMTELLAELKK